MDYEQKYKEALEKAKKLHGKSCINNVLEDLFPELQENEDERIRKALIEMIHDTTGDECEDCYHVSKESVLSWLEKQGEKKNTRKREIHDAYLQGVCDTKHEIEKQGKKLDADDVIAWLVANICDFEYYVKRFKEDFELC